MAEHTRVVVIGGGAVGVSSLYHLAKAGWKDCVLLEQNELTSGSTWHAAGNCPTFSTSWGLLKLQKYSAELYRRLGDQVGYPINYHVVGAIRLAHTRSEWTSSSTSAPWREPTGWNTRCSRPKRS